MPFKDKKAHQSWTKDWLSKHPDRREVYRVRDREYNKQPYRKVQKYLSNRRRGEALKLEVLTHYSPQGILQCSWSECPITDIDMLTLDHVNNDGHKERKTSGRGGGVATYHYLKSNHFPPGYQTLCGGHQLKKEFQHKRALKEAEVALLIQG